MNTIHTTNRPVSSPRPGARCVRAHRGGIAFGLLLAVWLGGWLGVAEAQSRPGARLCVLTRHSGVVRMQSWRKGFVFQGWVDHAQKTAYVGPGDWIELSGSGSQGDIRLPDMTTILMRRAADVQILKIGGKGGENAIRLRNGLSLDVSLTDTTTRLLLPDARAIRGRRADLLIRFQPHFGRIRVRHVRGEPLQVFKDGRPVRSLEFGQVLDLRLEPEESFTPTDQDLARRFVFRAVGRRVEISPGVTYELQGNRLRFKRAGKQAGSFGLIRIEDEVLVIGPGSEVEVLLPPPED